MIQYKALKHKTLPGTYGYEAGNPVELCHVSIPRLLGMNNTMESIRAYWHDQPLILEQLNDYDLITVMVIPGLTAVDVAAGLFNIHHHDEVTDKIVYDEDELLDVLKSWGLPMPDWEGHAKRNELELLSPPGDTIKETMDELGIDMHVFVITISTLNHTLTRRDIHGLFNGDTPITPEIAASLQDILNIDAQFWLNREANYREKLTKLQNK